MGFEFKICGFWVSVSGVFGSAEFCAFVLSVAQQIKVPVGESLGAMRFQGCKRLSLDCNGDDV